MKRILPPGEGASEREWLVSEKKEPAMNDWQLRIDMPEEEPEIAKAYAQGIANMTGRNVRLLREDHGEKVFVERFYPEPKQ